MRSRKKNKGKERRAKKEAAENQTCLWRRWALGYAPGRETKIEPLCSHGCVALPPPGHAVSRFMNDAFVAWKNHRMMATKDTFLEHNEVWKDDDHRRMAIDVLLSVGTNLMLSDVNNDDYEMQKIMAGDIGFVSLMLECYDGRGDFVHAAHSAAAQGGTVLASGNARDVLKFYSKRLPCSCLRGKYKQARETLPKMGECQHCHQNKERATLWTCGRCKIPLYCSRACQVAHVPSHKRYCGIYVDVRKQHGEKKKALSS